MTTVPIVELQGLRMDYQGRGGLRVEAVRGVDLRIERGEITLILGPSGCGKTTLLSLLAGFLEPTGGAVRIAGQDIFAMGAEALTGFRLMNVGFVFQSFRLIDALTAVENVEIPLNLASIKRPESRDKAKALLEEVGLGSRIDFLPDALSGGEKQRVAVARALALEPMVLLADEPTASLDSRAGERVVRTMVDSVESRRATLLMVGHDERLIPYATRILRMEDGLIGPENGQRGDSEAK